MSTVRQTSSSSTTSVGDEMYAGMDERKRKRMISNRDSARRSRMRKQKMMEDLTNELTKLQCENNGIVGKIDETKEGFMVFSAENKVLRAQAEELVERFRSLIRILKNSGLKLEIPDMPDLLLKPCRLPCPSEPVMASSEVFQL